MTQRMYQGKDTHSPHIFPLRAHIMATHLSMHMAQPKGNQMYKAQGVYEGVVGGFVCGVLYIGSQVYIISRISKIFSRYNNNNIT